jgi:putative aldouronate transport system substrate-binding protein
MRRAVWFVLLVTVPLAFAVAAGSKDDPQASGQRPNIRIVCRSLGTGDTTNNDILNELKKRIPFDFTVELKSSVEYPQQCRTIIASGDYPDMMEFWSVSYPNELEQMSEDKVIIPVDDLLAKYGKNILANRSEPTSLWFRSPLDGKTYAIPCRQLEMATNDCFVIRQDWLDKLGLKVPDSTADFYSVLKAFKDGDPDGNGKSDTVPFSGFEASTVLRFVTSEFGMVYGDWNVVDGKLVHYSVMPQFKGALAFVRKLYQEKLLDNELPVLNRENFFKKMYTNVIGAHYWYVDQLDKDTGSWIGTFYSLVPNAKLSLMNYYPDKTGKRRGYSAKQPQELIIFAKSKFPAACVQYADYLMSEEGSNLAEFGIQGKHWDMVDGRPKLRSLTDKDKQLMGFWMYNWMAKRTYLSAAVPKEIRDKASIYGPNMVPTPLNKITAADREFGAGLNDLTNKSIMTMIVDPAVNLDTAFQAYVDKFYASGGRQVSEQRTAEYAKLKK